MCFSGEKPNILMSPQWPKMCTLFKISFAPILIDYFSLNPMLQLCSGSMDRLLDPGCSLTPTHTQHSV